MSKECGVAPVMTLLFLTAGACGGGQDDPAPAFLDFTDGARLHGHLARRSLKVLRKGDFALLDAISDFRCEGFRGSGDVVA